MLLSHRLADTRREMGLVCTAIFPTQPSVDPSPQSRGPRTLLAAASSYLEDSVSSCCYLGLTSCAGCCEGYYFQLQAHADIDSVHFDRTLDTGKGAWRPRAELMLQIDLYTRLLHGLALESAVPGWGSGKVGQLEEVSCVILQMDVPEVGGRTL